MRRSRTIDSDEYTFVTNSTVLNISASQRGTERRTEEKRIATETGPSGPDDVAMSLLSDSAPCDRSIDRNGNDDARVLDAPRSYGVTKAIDEVATADCLFVRRRRPRVRSPTIESYLVDPASSHMLVSKIKPCMSKHKL